MRYYIEMVLLRPYLSPQLIQSNYTVEKSRRIKQEMVMLLYWAAINRMLIGLLHRVNTSFVSVYAYIYRNM